MEDKEHEIYSVVERLAGMLWIKGSAHTHNTFLVNAQEWALKLITYSFSIKFVILYSKMLLVSHTHTHTRNFSDY